MKNNFEEYFEQNSNEWISSAYDGTDYDYPVGAHRLRILKKALERENLEGKRVLDIGCGGGDISLFFAERGARVVGVDMSHAMLESAIAKCKGMEEWIQRNVKFEYAEFTNLINRKEEYGVFDYIVAFGLIGYIESDELFFEVISELSGPCTQLFLSCRNRLFNVTSVSNNTVDEIDSNSIKSLITEIEQYYEGNISHEEAEVFLTKLGNAINEISNIDYTKISHIEDKVALNVQPRQETPKEITEVAKMFSFQMKKFYGVHPHLLLPRFNRMLPPQIFNILSDALCVFEENNISLIWSSVFICHFIRNDNN